MERRAFLKTLATLGVSLSLPADLAAAPDSVIDRVWERTADQWSLFTVDDYGTLCFANFREPETHRDVFDLPPVHSLTAEHVAGCYPLECFVVDECDRAATARGLSEQEAEDFAYEFWRDWFDGLSPADRTRMNQAIERWLDDAIDWEFEGDWIYEVATAQGAAYRFFLGWDWRELERIGVAIIEGEYPGSSFFAARLRKTPEEANNLAIEQGLPMRFVSERRA